MRGDVDGKKHSIQQILCYHSSGLRGRTVKNLPETYPVSIQTDKSQTLPYADEDTGKPGLSWAAGGWGEEVVTATLFSGFHYS
jgi:hypothetical protein